MGRCDPRGAETMRGQQNPLSRTISPPPRPAARGSAAARRARFVPVVRQASIPARRASRVDPFPGAHEMRNASCAGTATSTWRSRK